ncbi:4Fe-4S binding protein [uncultured Thermanaerothrix sp.]|uniref:4Fe-4S binding protein n=1 Tax=uncultured Thermanaerothrix sp. TaxID=1195149 RepID=UPI00344F6A74
MFTILSGLWGSQVGSHNFATIFVWIAWWSALKLFFIPIGGRTWCSICPLPLLGEWLQNRGILRSRDAQCLHGKSWPRAWRNAWIPVVSFLLVGWFGVIILTSPRTTAFVLLGLFVLATLLGLIYERRAFCRYICPVGGFSGLYTRLAPPAIRVSNTTLCTIHIEKTCYNVCPWGQYPLALKTSGNCGLCMECLRACPYQNISLSLRPWGIELSSPPKMRVDEVFLALVMLTTAGVDAAIFLGPWGALKSATYTVGSPGWWIFATAFLLLVLGIVPAFYALTTWIAQRIRKGGLSPKSSFTYYGPILLPLGLMAWIAFTLAFASTKLSYLLPVLSDPLGWGWNLLGLTNHISTGQTPLLSSALQTLILAGGAMIATKTARELSRSLYESIPCSYSLLHLPG